MPGLLDVLRAAIAPAAAARAGWLQGEEVKRERERQQQLAQIQIERQSILDQIRAHLDASRANYYDQRANTAAQGKPDTYDQTIGEDGTVYLRNRNDPTDIQPAIVNGRPLKARAPFGGALSRPSTLRTKNGIYQWNPDSESWEPTGLESPTGGAAAANSDRINAKTALDEVRKGIPSTKGVPKTIPNPDITSNDPTQRKAAMRQFTVPNPAYQQRVQDSVTYMRDKVAPLEKNLLNKTAPGVLQDSTAAPSTDGTTGGTTTQTAAARARQSAMQDEYDTAARAYQAAKTAGDQDAETKYNAVVSKIAAKYGQGNQ